MSFSENRAWLEKVCGPADTAGDPTVIAPDLAASSKAFEDRQDFLDATVGVALDQLRDGIKGTLQNVSIKGRIDSGHALRRDERVNVEILASLNKDGSVPVGVEQSEWDSYAEAASSVEFLVIDGQKHEIASPEATARIREIGVQLAPLYRLSQEMAAMTGPETGPDGQPKRLFEDRDIEKELWSPLVREGVIPSNLVPKQFSETVNVMRNGSAIYTELMAQEDGTEMGPKKGIDKFLSYAKDAVSIGKVVGGEILRYDNLGVVEASRADMASFLKNKTKVDVDSQALGDLGVVPEDYPEGHQLSPLQVTRAKFDQQSGTEGGQTNFAAWLASQETALSGDTPSGMTAEEQSAQLEAIKAAKLTEDYGEYVRKQAMLNCAAAVATGSIEAAQRARDRKRSRRDVAEALAEGMIDAFAAGMTTRESATDLTQDTETKNSQFKIKYACLATKAGIRGVNKLSQVIRPSDRTGPVDKRQMMVDALGDILDGIGEAVTATGGVDDTSDTRYERGKIGLLIKGVALAPAMVDGLIDAAQKRDWAAVFATLATAGVAVPASLFAGEIGDLTRKDVALDDIEAGKGFDGSGTAFGNPFIEVHGAAGQTGFGMSGDMATLADQRSVVVEARELLEQIGDEGYGTAKGEIAKKFDRIRDMARANPELAQEAEIAAFLNPDPGEPLTKEAAQAAMTRIMQALDVVPLDDALAGAARDAAIIANLDQVEDPAKLRQDVDDLRGLLDGYDGGAPPDDAEVFAKFKEIRDNMLTDERVLAGIQSDIAEDEAWLEELKAEADLTRLDSFTDPELRERERLKAIDAIQRLTIELKKTEMKLNMLDQASKGAVGIVLMAVPGAALLGKIRDLVADIAKLSRRASELRKWQRQMEAMRGNYSVYEYAVVGEKEVTATGVVHDSAAVAADVAGVAAEALRLADHTHITAAVLTTIEKMTKSLNEFWFRKWGESRIRSGWQLYKDATRNPENRRLAREAIRENTTLGKCVLAYGACIDKDAQARTAVQACGLTPEVFEDGMDVCQAVVQYLRARLHDGEVETIASHDADAQWLPCKLEIKFANWTMIKATAMGLDPALDAGSGKTPQIDGPLQECERLSAADGADLDTWKSKIDELHTALMAYRPRKPDGKLHAEMNITTRDFADVVGAERLRLMNAIRDAAGADEVVV